MKNFVYIYHANMKTPPSQEDMQKWGAWMQSIGTHLVDGGNPLNESKAKLSEGNILTNDDANDDVIGYSIVKANNINEAIELAKGNPLTNAPGCYVMVYETGKM